MGFKWYIRKSKPSNVETLFSSALVPILPCAAIGCVAVTLFLLFDYFFFVPRRGGLVGGFAGIGIRCGWYMSCMWVQLGPVHTLLMWFKSKRFNLEQWSGYVGFLGVSTAFVSLFCTFWIGSQRFDILGWTVYAYLGAFTTLIAAGIYAFVNKNVNLFFWYMCAVLCSLIYVLLVDQFVFKQFTSESTVNFEKTCIRLLTPFLGQALIPPTLFATRRLLRVSNEIFPTLMVVLLAYHSFFARYFAIGLSIFTALWLTPLLTGISIGWYLLRWNLWRIVPETIVKVSPLIRDFLYPSEEAKLGHMTFITMELQCDICCSYSSFIYSLLFRIWPLNQVLVTGLLQLTCILLQSTVVRLLSKWHKMPSISCSSGLQLILGLCYAQMIWSMADTFIGTQYSVQPVLDTRRKQSQLWGDLILNWCRHNKIYELNVTEAANSALFCNQAINRKLPMPGIKMFIDDLVAQGNAEWVDKEKNRANIMWRKIDHWANLIYKWVSDKGMLNSVLTVWEIQNGDDSVGQDTPILMKALQMLEKQQRAEVFSGTSEDNLGVKFFSV